MKIVYWSHLHGHAATSSNLIACAVMRALLSEDRLAIMQSQFKWNNLDYPLLGRGVLQDQYYDTGMDALERDTATGILTQEIAHNDSISALENLSIFTATKKPIEEIYRDNLKGFLAIINELDKFYAHLYIDLSGSGKLSDTVMEAADLVVVNVPQNEYHLQEYFSNPVRAEHVMYLVGRYNADSSMNLKNMQRVYPQMKGKAAAIPYNTDFMDALSAGRAIPFFMQNLDAGRGSVNYDFIKRVKNAVQMINERVGEG